MRAQPRRPPPVSSAPARASALLVSALLACAAAPQPSPVPAPAPEAPPNITMTAVSAPGSDDLGLVATSIEFGWGSTGVVAADMPIPYWVMALFDVEVRRDVTGVELVEVELFDAESRSLGRALRELELRVTPEGASLYTDTRVRFDGTLRAGRPLRLRLRARMEDAFAGRVTTPPATFRVTLHNDGGAILRITGPVGPQWSTG